VSQNKTRTIIIITLIVLFAAVAVLVMTGSFSGVEDGIYSWVYARMNLGLTSFMVFVSHIGSVRGVIIIIVLLLIIPKTRMVYGIPILINLSVSSSLNSLLKVIFSRDRPSFFPIVAETGYSFPSGHAMNNTALYTMLALLIFRRTENRTIRYLVLIPAILFPAVIGYSRIYLGVHYAGDVLGGWILGVAVTLTIDSVLIYLKNRAERKTRE